MLIRPNTKAPVSIGAFVLTSDRTMVESGLGVGFDTSWKRNLKRTATSNGCIGSRFAPVGRNFFHDPFCRSASENALCFQLVSALAKSLSIPAYTAKPLKTFDFLFMGADFTQHERSCSTIRRPTGLGRQDTNNHGLSLGPGRSDGRRHFALVPRPSAGCR